MNILVNKLEDILNGNNKSLDNILNDIKGNIINKQKLSEYIENKNLNLIKKLLLLNDIEDQLKFLLLIYKIMPKTINKNCRFYPFKNLNTKNIDFNIKSKNLLIKINGNNSRIFGLKLKKLEYKKNIKNNNLFMFLNENNIKIYCNIDLIIINYSSIKTYNIFEEYLYLYFDNDKMKIEMESNKMNERIENKLLNMNVKSNIFYLKENDGSNLKENENYLKEYDNNKKNNYKENNENSLKKNKINCIKDNNMNCIKENGVNFIKKNINNIKITKDDREIDMDHNDLNDNYYKHRIKDDKYNKQTVDSSNNDKKVFKIDDLILTVTENIKKKESFGIINSDIQNNNQKLTNSSENPFISYKNNDKNSNFIIKNDNLVEPNIKEFKNYENLYFKSKILNNKKLKKIQKGKFCNKKLRLKSTENSNLNNNYNDDIKNVLFSSMEDLKQINNSDMSLSNITDFENTYEFKNKILKKRNKISKTHKKNNIFNIKSNTKRYNNLSISEIRDKSFSEEKSYTDNIFNKNLYNNKSNRLLKDLFLTIKDEDDNSIDKLYVLFDKTYKKITQNIYKNINNKINKKKEEFEKIIEYIRNIHKFIFSDKEENIINIIKTIIKL